MSYLNPKYERYADRIQALIEEGQEIPGLAQSRNTEFGVRYSITNPNQRILHAWLIRVTSIVETVFGNDSTHQHHLNNVIETNKNRSHYPATTYQIIGVLEGGLDDLRNGFLTQQEFLIAGEVFDSVLEQARHLIKPVSKTRQQFWRVL